jgi:hypothetical protein
MPLKDRRAILDRIVQRYRMQRAGQCVTRPSLGLVLTYLFRFSSILASWRLLARSVARRACPESCAPSEARDSYLRRWSAATAPHCAVISWLAMVANASRKSPAQDQLGIGMAYRSGLGCGGGVSPGGVGASAGKLFCVPTASRNSDCALLCGTLSFFRSTLFKCISRPEFFSYGSRC